MIHLEMSCDPGQSAVMPLGCVPVCMYLRTVSLRVQQRAVRALQFSTAYTKIARAPLTVQNVMRNRATWQAVNHWWGVLSHVLAHLCPCNSSVLKHVPKLVVA